MIRLGRNDALEVARETIADLRRRLDDTETIADLRRRLDESEQDRRMLLQRMTELVERLATQPRFEAPAPMVDLSSVLLPPQIMDEITLVATNGAMARHLEQWATSELRRGTDMATICERIRDGDEVMPPKGDDE